MLNSNLMRNILYMSLAIWCGFPFAAIAQTACQTALRLEAPNVDLIQAHQGLIQLRPSPRVGG
ncbi:hypothetical protein XPU_4804 [Xanthomonas arboricola pv. pruni str. MAFF 311562]|uniref:Uncharacterized protein n=1 Tax=Xanthomonas arboricola pv. pruni str. MAFF 311562 TaxID=1414836 RepID=W4SA49_9XANT|nr:hypothetical protein XPU_4804 [Xanthomonas arboricola pv. pruni str. MAFF 311562]GAE61865.1 hypothetical protein XPN_3771 [Xanthomonas arboricola pv. pruni MAFF 301427]